MQRRSRRPVKQQHTQSKHPTGNVKIVLNCIENPHKLNCMMFNADSLTNKIPEFELLVKTKMPHIIGINEALPKNFKRKIYEQEFILNEYEMVCHPNIAANKGRGSILYIHKSLNFKEISIKTSKIEFEESILCEINLNKEDKLLCALLCRRGDSSDEINESFIQLFHEICKKKEQPSTDNGRPKPAQYKLGKLDL